MNRDISKKLYKKMKKIMPGGVSSPVRAAISVKTDPVIVRKGRGSSFEDIDGNVFLDFCMSWGALLHGHAHPKIVKAAREAIVDGSSFGISTEAEYELASFICQHVPGCEMIRFVSTGTEATMSLARLSRAYTKRSLIVKFQGHYHGHHDQFLIKAGSGASFVKESFSSGIPSSFLEHTALLPFNDSQALVEFFQKRGTEVAAIILEPIAANMGVVPANFEFMKKAKELTQKHGSVLIFDEVITGFRVSLEGAQSLYNVQPDLFAFGKIIGGGFPAAAYGGVRKIMEHIFPSGNVYQAGTLSGNPVAMKAGLTALNLSKRKGFYEKLNQKTTSFVRPIQEFLKQSRKNCCLQQCGSMFTLFFGARKVENSEDLNSLDNELFAKFFNYMLDSGIYIPPQHNEAWFISSVHKDKELQKAQNTILQFLKNAP